MYNNYKYLEYFCLIKIDDCKLKFQLTVTTYNCQTNDSYQLRRAIIGYSISILHIIIEYLACVNNIYNLYVTSAIVPIKATGTLINIYFL